MTKIRRTRLGLEIILWLIFFVALYAFVQWRGSGTAAFPDRLPPIVFQRLDGQPIVLAPRPGQILWVNFWSPNCPPCLAELPVLEQVQRLLGGNSFTVLAIAVPGSSVQEVTQLQHRLGLTFPIYRASREGNLRKWGGIQLTPTSLLVDAKGRVVGRFVGPIAMPVLFWKLLWIWIRGGWG